MLSAGSAVVVRATASVVAEHAELITARFYPRMFHEHPELLGLFNQGNQASGEQSRALAASVVAYAVHLIDPAAPSFTPVLERIAHKHRSLGVRPEQYTIVGRHLLAAVKDVLGDAISTEVAAAWEEVYWLFATQLVAEEARLYQQAGVDPDQPWRPWRVAQRIQETSAVVSLVLQPADGGVVPDVLPGQYVTVVVDLPDGQRQPRQYTLSSAQGGNGLRITVRRVAGARGAPAGRVSTFLHDHVGVGDLLQISAPAGDVVLPPGNDPLLLISAGVGVTPIAAVVAHLAATQPHRQVVLAHADRCAQDHALRAEVLQAGRGLEHLTAHAWYEQVASDDGEARAGFMDLTDLPLPDDVRVFMCGPLPFMREARAVLLRRGVPADRINYEVFGPDLWAQTPPA